MNILILKPSSLGDVIQALPVLRQIKLELPRSRIWWWIESALAPLLEDDPDLEGVIRFDRDGWVNVARWPEYWKGLTNVRHRQFDCVIDLQCLARSAVFAWLANGKFTLGLDEPREGARGFYDVVVRRRSFHTHAVDWYLEVLPVLGVPRRPFVWLPQRLEIAAEVHRKWNLGDHRWVVLQPGARWTNKRWPVSHFTSLIRNLARTPALRFAILGGKSDTAIASEILFAAPDRCLDLTGKTSLPEMVEWIRLAELVISNDTGPMHVAAALRRPLIALFGPTEPRRTGPYDLLHSVMNLQLPCAPCLKPRCGHRYPIECLQKIEPEAVARKARQLLGV